MNNTMPSTTPLEFPWLPDKFMLAGEQESRDYVTVVTTTRPCGKRVELDSQGNPFWKTNGDVIEGWAVTVRVPDPQHMAQLLGLLPPNHYIIPDFIAAAGHKPYLMLSQHKLHLLLDERGIEHNPDRPEGLHELPELLDQGVFQAAAKLKENFTPGAWRLFDFDRDQSTPPELAALTPDGAIARLEEALPGLQGCGRVIVPSSKGRVLGPDGRPLSASPNFHMWVQVEDPEQTDSFRVRLWPHLHAMGMGWKKPKHARGDPNKIVGSGPAAIVDPAVWAISRCVYAGAPMVGDGLTLGPAKITASDGGRFRLASLPPPSRTVIRQLENTLGTKAERRGDGRLTYRDDTTLRAETELEVWVPGQAPQVFTVADCLDNPAFLNDRKYRCQAPSRDSISWNGILRKFVDGSLMVHDNGTGITYWYRPHEREVLERVAKQLSARFGPTTTPISPSIRSRRALLRARIKELIHG